MNGFALQSKERNSKETLAISYFASINKIPYKIIDNYKNIPDGFIPVGDVEWCQKVLKRIITPDYYPTFLESYLYRKVYKCNEWPLGKKVFIKPADKFKRFTGFITNGGYRKKKRPPYWCSEIVNFVNEWRYYVSNGEILTGEWYFGDEINTPDAPILDIIIPKDYCGAIDFGRLESGELALVEANHPFSCGWYGKDHKIYAKWIIDGWNYMEKVK
jgi:hypothetical protein